MKSWIILGAFLAALAVIFGAFGAHGLKNKVSPDDVIIFEPGVKYPMDHALVLILIGILGFYYNFQVDYYQSLQIDKVLPNYLR